MRKNHPRIGAAILAVILEEIHIPVLSYNKHSARRVECEGSWVIVISKLDEGKSGQQLGSIQLNHGGGKSGSRGRSSDPGRKRRGSF